MVTKRVALADVPRYRLHSDVPRHQKPERGYLRIFPGTKNRNEGTFAKTKPPFCFLSIKTSDRHSSTRPPFRYPPFKSAAILKLRSGIDVTSLSADWGQRFLPGPQKLNEGIFAKTALLRNRPFVSSRMAIVQG